MMNTHWYKSITRDPEESSSDGHEGITRAGSSLLLYRKKMKGTSILNQRGPVIHGLILKAVQLEVLLLDVVKAAPRATAHRFISPHQ